MTLNPFPAGLQGSPIFWEILIMTCLQNCGSGLTEADFFLRQNTLFWHHLISSYPFIFGWFMLWKIFLKVKKHSPKKAASKPVPKNTREFRLKEDALFRASLNEGGNEKRVVAAPRCTVFPWGEDLRVPYRSSSWHGALDVFCFKGRIRTSSNIMRIFIFYIGVDSYI